MFLRTLGNPVFSGAYAFGRTKSTKVFDIPLEFDVKNQARVHLWYEKKFGYPIQPYRSVEAAINTWPTTATAIAARIDECGYKICAPFGLNDLLGMIVRPNKTQINWPQSI
jgi:hypothetical protein